MTNLSYEQGDAQVHPFPDGSFDVVVSQFGVMFFEDPRAAFGNLRRALRPGGRLAFVCPREMTANPWYVAPLAALRARLGRDGLPDSGMFSLADPDHLTDLLAGCGFTDIELRALDVAMSFGADAADAADGFLGSGPVLAVLDSGGLDREEARGVLVDALRPFEGPAGVRIPGAHWLVTARAGGPVSAAG